MKLFGREMIETDDFPPIKEGDIQLGDMSHYMTFQIKLGEKYIIQLPSGVARDEIEMLRDRLHEWLKSDEPFFLVGGIKLVKIEDEEK